VAQLGARLDGIEEVVGSNPIGSTNLKRCAQHVPIADSPLNLFATSMTISADLERLVAARRLCPDIRGLSNL
jgi:hypothetical protein